MNLKGFESKNKLGKYVRLVRHNRVAGASNLIDDVFDLRKWMVRRDFELRMHLEEFSFENFFFKCLVRLTSFFRFVRMF